jgi:hypothetical protein
VKDLQSGGIELIHNLPASTSEGNVHVGIGKAFFSPFRTTAIMDPKVGDPICTETDGVRERVKLLVLQAREGLEVEGLGFLEIGNDYTDVVDWHVPSA